MDLCGHQACTGCTFMRANTQTHKVNRSFKKLNEGLQCKTWNLDAARKKKMKNTSWSRQGLSKKTPNTGLKMGLQKMKRLMHSKEEWIASHKMGKTKTKQPVSANDTSDRELIPRIYKELKLGQEWWHTLWIPESGRQKQAHFCSVWAQPDLGSAL